jgi:hypothetical protein
LENIYNESTTKASVAATLQETITQHATGIQVAACLAVLCCCLVVGLVAYLMVVG